MESLDQLYIQTERQIEESWSLSTRYCSGPYISGLISRFHLACTPALGTVLPMDITFPLGVTIGKNLVAGFSFMLFAARLWMETWSHQPGTRHGKQL